MRWSLILALPLIAGHPVVAAAAERGVAAMITEIHVGQGQVEVGSPFVVTAPPPERGRLQRGLTILEASLTFLSTTPRELFGNLGSRGGMKPPVILTPRNGPVLPDSLVFEWRGSRSSLYGVRIVGPDGPLFERAKVAGTRFQYPADAPQLATGIRYLFQLVPAWHPPQEVWFEVVDRERADAIRRDLRDLDEALPAGASPTTAVVLRAGFLSGKGLRHDARLRVTDELTRRPDEPTLHYLLGELCTRQGLSAEAQESFAEARFLLGGR